MAAWSPRRVRFLSVRDAAARCLAAIGISLVAATGVSQGADTGTTSVTVTPAVAVSIPAEVELSIDVDTVDFDLGGVLQGATIACVHGLANADLPALDGAGPTAADAVLPIGTGFSVSGFPAVEIVGGDPVEGFPPVALTPEGELVTGSKDDFVCYRTFLLRRFSNLSGWQLTVERQVAAFDREPERIYVRDGFCGDSLRVLGLVPLFEGSRVVLADQATSPSCPSGDVVVVAVKSSATLAAGAGTARLIYTLFAPVFE